MAKVNKSRQKFDKKPFYVQIMGDKGIEFQEVDGTPIGVEGAEDADLFLHRSVAGGGWRISSGVTGMYVAIGDTKKQVASDVAQKGKPEAIVGALKQYLDRGEPVSPRAKRKPKTELATISKKKLRYGGKIDKVIDFVLQHSKLETKGTTYGGYTPVYQGLAKSYKGQGEIYYKIGFMDEPWIIAYARLGEGEKGDRGILQSIEQSRTKRSREADEGQEHSLVIEPDDPRTEIWKRNPGRMDVRGIDTKLKSTKTGKRKRRSSSKELTSMRSMRGR